MKRIITDYHRGHPNFMDEELANALQLYTTYKAGTGATEEQVLECCLTGNHFRCLHVTKAKRPLLIADAVKELKKAQILSFSGGDFEALYSEVKKAIGGINQIGLLVLYDTTKAIGHLLGIEPVNYVYTQSGAKIGAKKLLGVKRMGWRLPTTVFAKYFPDEKSIYIENMLCIYKDYFSKGGANAKADTLGVLSTVTEGCGSTPKPSRPRHRTSCNSK